jgi:hypothetical protein
MNWVVCKKDFVRKVEIDSERINSIVEMALERFKMAKLLKEISFKMENYYEVVKELLVAYLLKNGLRSKNHQCLISYFYKENPNYESEAHLIGQMSFFRNRLGYYGEKVPEEFFINNKENFERIIKLLLDLIKKNE